MFKINIFKLNWSWYISKPHFRNDIFFSPLENCAVHRSQWRPLPQPQPPRSVPRSCRSYLRQRPCCSMYSACSSIMYLAYNGDSKERKKGGNNWVVKEATAPRLTIKANVAWKSSPGPSEPWVPRGQYPTTLPRTKTFSLYYYFQVFKPSYGPAS